MRVNERSENRAENSTFIKTEDIWSHHYFTNRRGKRVETGTSLIFFGSKVLRMVNAVIKVNVTCFRCKSYKKKKQNKTKKKQKKLDSTL